MRHERDTPQEDPTVVAATRGPTPREEVLDRESDRYGGCKWGAAFFGWLTAMGASVRLTAILSDIGAGVGLGAVDGDVQRAADELSSSADTVSIIGAVVLAVILFIAYYCGGYVAGLMARFSGSRQCLALWILSIAIAILVSIIAAIAGSEFKIFGNLKGFPRIPIDEGSLTATGIITAIAVVVISLIGAILGGLAGMRYHRKVDYAGLGR